MQAQQTQELTIRLQRPVTGRAISGVCAGLALYFKVDVALVRILFIVFAFAGGAAIPVYLVLWLLMPAEGGAAVLPGLQTSGADAGALLGAILVIAGVAWLLSNLGVLAFVQWNLVWPIVLVAVGALILLKRGK